MLIETERLMITEFSKDMVQVLHENSLDEDNRRFVPDEVFETLEEAEKTLDFLMGRYGTKEGPFVYPLITKAEKLNIGYVQLCSIEDGKWEIGYHIAKKYTGNGYATEGVKAFLSIIPVVFGVKEVYGILLSENIASRCVLEKCGFTTVFSGTGKYQGKDREIVKMLWRG